MLSEYRQRFSEFHTALHRAEYLFRSGRQAQLDTAPVWSEFSDLFQPSAIAELRAKLTATATHRATERTSIERLLAFALTGNLAANGRELRREIESYETHAHIEWDGQRINIDQAAELLGDEPDVPRRRELAARRADVVRGAQDLRAESWAQRQVAASALGYESYLALQRELRGVDFEPLATAASKFLAKTESQYVNTLAPLLAREVGVTLDEATPADLAYLERFTRYDHFFARARMLEIYRALFADLGFKTEKQTNVEIDAAARPHKQRAPFCAPLQVPDEIKLVVNPRGGQANYREFLQATGQAQHYAWTSRQLYPEFRINGDEAIAAAWGLLFANLLLDEHWLLNALGFVESHAFRQMLAILRLIGLRQQAALFNYEVEFHAGELSERAGARYVELLQDAARVRYDEAESLRVLSASLRGGSWLRAAAFEAQLRDHLKTQFGLRWWARRKAGELLIDLWNVGQRHTLEELAALIGLGALDFDSLAAEMIEKISI